MIDYGSKIDQPSWRWWIQITGSAFPKAFWISLPIALVAVACKVLHVEAVFGVAEADYVTGFFFLTDMSPWGAFSNLVVFVLVFRLSNAYTTYWSAYAKTNDFLGDWSGAASSAVVCSRGSKRNDSETERYLETVVRLFSMLSACALQELSPRKTHKVWGLLTLNTSDIDEQTIKVLDGSSMRVDLCYHWIQQLVVDSEASGILAAPGPMVTRILAELGSGMSNFGAAKRSATCQFNFPYAQTCQILLIFYSVLTPALMVRWSDWVSGAFIFTFLQLFFIWTLQNLTETLESPFESSDPNSIDVFELQLGMNNALLLLLHEDTRKGPPKLKPGSDATYEELQKRDTIHKRALLNEGWQLKGEAELRGSSTATNLNSSWMCCTCCGSTLHGNISMSKQYRSKRYTIVDDEKVAVRVVGIIEDDLIIALPKSIRRVKGAAAIALQAVGGRATKVFVKRIQIRDRHKLWTDVEKLKWTTGEYADFEHDVEDLDKQMYDCFKQFSNLQLATVSTISEIATAKKIADAQKADKEGLGIDQLAHLRTYEEFCSILIQDCGLEQSAADAEWERRKGLSEYEQEKNAQQETVIELDVDAFKKMLAEKERAEKKAQQLLEAARKGLLAAKDAGKIDGLSKQIREAEVNTKMTNEELGFARKLLTDWENAESALKDATAKEDTELLKAAINEAQRLQLKSEGFRAAQTALGALQTQKAQQVLADGQASGQIDVLEAKIEEAEIILKDVQTAMGTKAIEDARGLLKKLREEEAQRKVEAARKEIQDAKDKCDMELLKQRIKEAELHTNMSDEELCDAKKLLADWENAESALKDATVKDDPELLKAAINEAQRLQLLSEDLRVAQTALGALQTQKAQQVLADGQASGQIDVLEAKIEEAEIILKDFQTEAGTKAIEDARALLKKLREEEGAEPSAESESVPQPGSEPMPLPGTIDPPQPESAGAADVADIV